MPQPNHAEMLQAIVDGDVDRAKTLAQAAIDRSDDLFAAIENGFVAGIQRVGELWEEGEYFLPELVQGAEAMKAAMDIIHPYLSSNDRNIPPKGRVVLGTVQGDLHDIGKSLVGTLLSANGFEVHDLGCDVSIEDFINKAREVRAHIIGASALLTTTMTTQRHLVEAVLNSDLVLKPHVLIGGAPASDVWATEIGASYAENALQAVTVASKLLP